MNYKICTKCGEEKELCLFPKRKSSKDGRRTECISCKAELDSHRRFLKMQDVNFAEKEKLRLKKLRDTRSEEKKNHDNLICKERCADKRKSDLDKFFAENGITKQEHARRIKEKQFLQDASLVHEAGSYSYHLMNFKDITTKIEIWCNVHQESFWQLPKYHKKGQGCVKCGKIATGNALRKSQEDFIKDACEIWGNEYTFDNVDYMDNITHVSVTCPEHGDFPIKPGNLLSGKGCPACAKYGYRKSLPGYFYVMVCDNITKVGITNRTPELRLRDINKKKKGFTVLYSQYHESGAIPLAIETSMLWWLPLTNKRVDETFDGSTECFLDVDRDNIINVARNAGKLLEEQTCHSSIPQLQLVNAD